MHKMINHLRFILNKKRLSHDPSYNNFMRSAPYLRVDHAHHQMLLLQLLRYLDHTKFRVLNLKEKTDLLCFLNTITNKTLPLDDCCPFLSLFIHLPSEKSEICFQSLKKAAFLLDDTTLQLSNTIVWHTTNTLFNVLDRYFSNSPSNNDHVIIVQALESLILLGKINRIATDADSHLDLKPLATDVFGVIKCIISHHHSPNDRVIAALMALKSKIISDAVSKELMEVLITSPHLHKKELQEAFLNAIYFSMIMTRHPLPDIAILEIFTPPLTEPSAKLKYLILMAQRNFVFGELH